MSHTKSGFNWGTAAEAGAITEQVVNKGASQGLITSNAGQFTYYTMYQEMLILQHFF